jgi:malate dehydrogenase
MIGGATLTKLLGTSAWYAPGASVSYLVDSILNDKKKIIPCSVYLEGQYGLRDICIGVPCIIGKKGIEEIIDLDLNSSEKNKLNESANAIANMNKSLKDFI